MARTPVVVLSHHLLMVRQVEVRVFLKPLQVASKRRLRQVAMPLCRQACRHSEHHLRSTQQLSKGQALKDYHLVQLFRPGPTLHRSWHRPLDRLAPRRVLAGSLVGLQQLAPRRVLAGSLVDLQQLAPRRVLAGSLVGLQQLVPRRVLAGSLVGLQQLAIAPTLAALHSTSSNPVQQLAVCTRQVCSRECPPHRLGLEVSLDDR